MDEPDVDNRNDPVEAEEGQAPADGSDSDDDSGSETELQEQVAALEQTVGRPGYDGCKLCRHHLHASIDVRAQTREPFLNNAHY